MLVLQNFFYNHVSSRFLDIKIGETETGVGIGSGNGNNGSFTSSLGGGFANSFPWITTSTSEKSIGPRFRIADYVNAPRSLHLDAGKVKGEDLRKSLGVFGDQDEMEFMTTAEATRKGRLGMMDAREVLRSIVDLNGLEGNKNRKFNSSNGNNGVFDYNAYDLGLHFAPIEVSEIVLHEMVTRLCRLVCVIEMLSEKNLPQGWKGTSIGLGFDMGGDVIAGGQVDEGTSTEFSSRRSSMERCAVTGEFSQDQSQQQSYSRFFQLRRQSNYSTSPGGSMGSGVLVSAEQQIRNKVIVSAFDFGECLGFNTGSDELSEEHERRLKEIWQVYRNGVVSLAFETARTYRHLFGVEDTVILDDGEMEESAGVGGANQDEGAEGEEIPDTRARVPEWKQLFSNELTVTLYDFASSMGKRKLAEAIIAEMNIPELLTPSKSKKGREGFSGEVDLLSVCDLKVRNPEFVNSVKNLEQKDLSLSGFDLIRKAVKKDENRCCWSNKKNDGNSNSAGRMDENGNEEFIRLPEGSEIASLELTISPFENFPRTSRIASCFGLKFGRLVGSSKVFGTGGSTLCVEFSLKSSCGEIVLAGRTGAMQRFRNHSRSAIGDPVWDFSVVSDRFDIPLMKRRPLTAKTASAKGGCRLLPRIPGEQYLPEWGAAVSECDVEKWCEAMIAERKGISGDESVSEGVSVSNGDAWWMNEVEVFCEKLKEDRVGEEGVLLPNGVGMKNIGGGNINDKTENNNVVDGHRKFFIGTSASDGEGVLEKSPQFPNGVQVFDLTLAEKNLPSSPDSPHSPHSPIVDHLKQNYLNHDGLKQDVFEVENQSSACPLSDDSLGNSQKSY